jgi:hypothetical protein
MAALDDAAEEARRERQIRLTEDPDPDQLVLAVVRVRNDTIMIFRATSAPFPAPVGERLTPQIASIAGAASTYLRDLASAFETRAAPPMPTRVQAALAAYATEVEAIRADGLTRAMPTEAVERLFSLGFAFDQLGENLAGLAGCCGLYARPPVRPAARAGGA